MPKADDYGCLLYFFNTAFLSFHWFLRYFCSNSEEEQ